MRRIGFRNAHTLNLKLNESSSKQVSSDEPKFVQVIRNFWKYGIAGTLLIFFLGNLKYGITLELAKAKKEDDKFIKCIDGAINALGHTIKYGILSSIFFPHFFAFSIHDHKTTRTTPTIFGTIKNNHIKLYFIPNSSEIIELLKKKDEEYKKTLEKNGQYRREFLDNFDDKVFNKINNDNMERIFAEVLPYIAMFLSQGIITPEGSLETNKHTTSQVTV